MPKPAALVLVDGSSGLQFDYGLPDHLATSVVVGCRVRIPLRNRAAVGTVIDLHEVDEEGFKLKDIQSLVDPEPVLTPPLINLARWMSDYYTCGLENAFRAMLPQAARDGKGGEQMRKQVRLIGDAAELVEKLGKRARRQAELVTHLDTQPKKSQRLSELLDELGVGRPSITALEKAGAVVVEDVVVKRDPFADEEFLQSSNLTLNPKQAEAFAAVRESIEQAGDEASAIKPLLLHGVTGSGKTEVYLQAIEFALDRGQGSIVLVPEISLTPQTAERFKKRFAAIQDQVAIMHSHLSQGERHDEWRKVLRREARIVIGARSAIFAPVENLGLIVVDEEHENSYKQESPPRYHARDIAVVRAKLEGCAVLLGSATPSLESWHNTQIGKYRLLDMPERVDDQKMPLIRILDMRIEARKQQGGMAILSNQLRQLIEKRVADGEQTILFLNRRGFARSLLCPECGKVSECAHCSIPLTFHKTDDRLICHICGYARIVPRRCGECNARNIILAGYGTEKVEEVLKKVFTGARIARVDTDVMKRKNMLRKTLADFKAKKIDILLGTQMIAKGLHFPNVTLVGILNADIGLHVPDFRAGERTFQLLTQVAGRAGRGELEGEVVVQTFTPHHPAIQFARHHDFIGFAEQELDFRQKFEFPPFVHMVMVTVRSVHAKRAEFSLKTLYSRLKRDLPPGADIGEPLPSPLVKSHDQFRYQTMLRAVNPRSLVRHIRKVMEPLSFPEDVIVTVDVDPYQLS